MPFHQKQYQPDPRALQGLIGMARAHAIVDADRVPPSQECAPATRADIQALREEIAALRELLSPPSTLIITGPEVGESLKRMRERQS